MGEHAFLTRKALNISIKTLETRGFISILYKCLIQLFPIHLNTYVMGLGQYKYFYAYSAEIDFRRQNLWSTDVRLYYDV